LNRGHAAKINRALSGIADSSRQTVSAEQNDPKQKRSA
jgi:hypothetical protein